jgi:hypothetical protein
MTPYKTLILILSSLMIAACGDADVTPAGQPTTVDAPTASVAAKPEPVMDGASPGKPSAPISMTYEIVGNPIVGVPVLINVDVHSEAGPVTVHYRINDTSALMFQDGQVERWQIPDPASAQTQQLSVVPQREGRLYVNVSAEVMTANGAMIRSMSIPIKVGASPAAPIQNGELVEGPDGEKVISLPARETN